MLNGFVAATNITEGDIRFAFGADAGAESGEAFVATDAVWRVHETEWTAPPVTCLVPGQPIEMGVALVQTQDSPGLLSERVVWITCLPADG